MFSCLHEGVVVIKFLERALERLNNMTPEEVLQLHPVFVEIEKGILLIYTKEEI